MEDITGVDVIDLIPSGRGDLVDQLNEATRRVRLGHWAVVAAIVVLFVKPPIGLIIALVMSPGIAYLVLRDRARRAVVVFYDVNDEAATWFQQVVDAVEQAGKVARRWRINTSGTVRTTYQYKVNSGASSIVSRSDLAANLQGPKPLKTNIAVPTLRAGKQALHFLPDRVLVTDGKRFTDVAYAALDVAASSGRFIESERRPKDATQVDTTWHYVNVKGGPDRRYNNNRQLPVMLYGNLELATASGLHWLLQCSRQDGFSGLARALQIAPKSIERESASDTSASFEDDFHELDLGTEKAFQKTASYSLGKEGQEANGAVGDQVLPPPVPRSDEQRAALLESKPPAWENLLFSSYLLEGKEALEPKWRDLKLNLASGRRRRVGFDDASAHLQSAMGEVQDQIAKLMSAISPKALTPAFGAPGEPGDPNLIEHLARRFIEVYEALLEWPAQLRSLNPPAALAPACETASHFVDMPLETIREFIDEQVKSLDGLAEQMRSGGPIRLVFNLTLEMDESLVARFEEQLAGARSAG